MRFPTIIHYKEAVYNIGERLRTLQDIHPILDSRGEPRFHASRGCVTFAIEHAGAVQSLRCFTNMSGYERAAAVAGTLFEHELFVFDDNQAGDYYTIMLSNATVVSLAEPILVEPVEGLVAVQSGGLWGYVDGNGEGVIEPQYDSATDFSEGRAVVGKGGLYGLINTDGELVVEIKYDEVSWDGSSVAYLDMRGKWGAVDRVARSIFECRYDWVGEYSNDLLLVCRHGKYGYVDKSGVEVIPLVHDGAGSFDSNGIASVTAAGRQYVIDTEGKEIT